MDIAGRIHKIMDVQQVSATFQKRVVVIEQTTEDTAGKIYSELISLEFIQDKCSLLDNYQVGQNVEILFNLKGREWTSPQGEVKYFNTLQAWQIHSDEKAPEVMPPAANAAPTFEQPTKTEAQPVPTQAAPVEMPKFNTEAEDDIPF